MVLFTFAFAILGSLLFLPRGNVLHEILHLPAYWWRLHRLDTSCMQEERLCYGDHHRQYLIFIPPPPHKEQPDKLIVYFHGGGWKFGKPENFKGSVLALHEAGYPIVLPSHRRTPHYNYFDMREDLNQILLTILELQRKRNWAGQKIVLSGMSAGGNLAALLCYDQAALAKIGLTRNIFAGLLVCAAPLALEKMKSSLLLSAFAGRKGSEQFRLANPVEYVRQDTSDIPVFCLHGECDGLVAHQSSATFVEILQRDQPDKVKFVSTPGGTHLEIAAWGHGNENLKREILSWLQKL